MFFKVLVAFRVNIFNHLTGLHFTVCDGSCLCEIGNSNLASLRNLVLGGIETQAFPRIIIEPHRTLDLDTVVRIPAFQVVKSAKSSYLFVILASGECQTVSYCIDNLE